MRRKHNEKRIYSTQLMQLPWIGIQQFQFFNWKLSFSRKTCDMHFGKCPLKRLSLDSILSCLFALPLTKNKQKIRSSTSTHNKRNGVSSNAQAYAVLIGCSSSIVTPALVHRWQHEVDVVDISVYLLTWTLSIFAVYYASPMA